MKIHYGHLMQIVWLFIIILSAFVEDVRAVNLLVWSGTLLSVLGSLHITKLRYRYRSLLIKYKNEKI